MTTCGVSPTNKDHFNRYNWKAEHLRRLGRIPDIEVAELAGVHPQTVKSERNRQGIPACYPKRKKIVWTDKMLDLLGNYSDRNVAEMLGIGHRSVFYRRHLTGIEAYGAVPGRPDSHQWTSSEIAMLGKIPDREVSRLTGLSATAAATKRRKLKIPPYRAPFPQIDWTPEIISLLGEVTDAEVSRRFGMTSDSIRGKRKELGIEVPSNEARRSIKRDKRTAELLAKPNKEVMAFFGVSKRTVLKLRREMGIPSPNTRSWRWTEEVVGRFGKEPDAHIARDLGVTTGAVSWKRNQLGIKPYKKTNKS